MREIATLRLTVAAFLVLSGCGDDPPAPGDGPRARDLGPGSEGGADGPRADVRALDAPQGDSAPPPGPCNLIPQTPLEYTPSKTYWGRNNYVQYIAGDLPIVISSPHGGYLRPSEIPDRTYGVLAADTNSQEYTLEVAHYLKKLTGRRPHVIINRLHRRKLDANRAIQEAAQGSKWAEQA